MNPTMPESTPVIDQTPTNKKHKSLPIIIAATVVAIIIIVVAVLVLIPKGSNTNNGSNNNDNNNNNNSADGGNTATDGEGKSIYDVIGTTDEKSSYTGDFYTLYDLTYKDYCKDSPSSCKSSIIVAFDKEGERPTDWNSILSKLGKPNLIDQRVKDDGSQYSGDLYWKFDDYYVELEVLKNKNEATIEISGTGYLQIYPLSYGEEKLPYHTKQDNTYKKDATYGSLD